MKLNRRELLAGLADGLPLVPSTALLGLIFGAGAQVSGVSQITAVAMSALVFSGSGQFAALPLWAENGMVIALTTFVIALRFALMTASMAPRLEGAPAWMRGALAYCVTDENFALAVSRRGGEMEPGYLAGTWVALYGSWVLGTAAGTLFGAQVPPVVAEVLGSVFPIVFITLIVLTCTSRPAAVVATVGALLGVAGYLSLPNGWHVVVAGLCASLMGPVLERTFGRRRAR